MSKNRFIGIVIVLLLFSSRAIAQPGSQNFDKVWLQGGSVTLTTTFNHGQVPDNKIIKGPNFLYFVSGNSNICDSSGNLLFACDGFRLYDKDLSFIEGGELLVPDRISKVQSASSGYAQTSIILPFDNGKYILVTPTASDDTCYHNWEQHEHGAYFDLLLMHEIDMNANGGKGKVIRRMVPLLKDVRLSKTQMMACRHGDGKSWWLLKQAIDTNLVYKFLITDSEVYGPYIQGFTGKAGHFGGFDITGQSMFSQDGTKYATTILGFSKVFLADFDRCSGMLANPVVYDVPLPWSGNPYNSVDTDFSTCNLAFSPNGRYLYVSGYTYVQQLALYESNPAKRWTYLSGPDTTWQQFQGYETMYPAPDGKIYIGNVGGLGGQMSAINYPDNYGLAAGFCKKCLRFPAYFDPRDSNYYFYSVGTPPCMPNYHLGPTNPICYSVGVTEPIVKAIDLQLYPNPVTGILNITYSEAGSLEISDITGRRIKTIALLGTKGGKAIVDMRGIATGVCICRYYADGKLMEVRKIMIQHE